MATAAGGAGPWPHWGGGGGRVHVLPCTGAWQLTTPCKAYCFLFFLLHRQFLFFTRRMFGHKPSSSPSLKLYWLSAWGPLLTLLLVLRLLVVGILQRPCRRVARPRFAGKWLVADAVEFLLNVDINFYYGSCSNMQSVAHMENSGQESNTCRAQNIFLECEIRVSCLQ